MNKDFKNMLSGGGAITSASRGIEANEGFLNKEIEGRHPGQARSADPGSHNRRNFAIADQVRNDVTNLPSYHPTLLPSKRAAFTKPSRATKIAKQSERRVCVNGNVEFSLQTRAVAFNARRSFKIPAFTLAEVLITLAIVGVVAAITLPPLITNIQSQVKAKRVQNIKQKFSKATDKMLAMSGMNGYGSTENFVEELKHHLKIAKVCDNEHLTECWGYEKVKLKDGKEWEISKTKTGKTLKMTDSETEEWANTVGIVTADGTSMILSYNKKCDMTTNINPQWDENQSSSTNCVAAVFDYNGGTKPNKFIGDITSKDFAKSDVIAFNAGGLGQDCKVELNGKCFTKVVKLTSAEVSSYGYTWCAGHTPTSSCYSNRIGQYLCPSVSAGAEATNFGISKCFLLDDYWATAVAMCKGINNMPNQSDLEKLANAIYETDKFTNSGENILSATMNTSIATSFGFSSQNFRVWSGVEKDNSSAYFRTFNLTSSDYYYYTNHNHSPGNGRDAGNSYALCSE